MANKLYNDTYISAIAAAIRGKLGTTAKYTVSQMASAINSIVTEPELEEVTITPTESQQTKTPSKYGFSKVIVNAISNTYIGSAIARRTSADMTASGASVTAPAGYYASSTSKSVASGSAGTPSASKGSVSNHSITVTPTVTNTTGYINGGTKTGTAVTVSASDLVNGSETKTANGTYDVTNLKELVVSVSGGGLPSGFTAIAKGTHTLGSAVTGSNTFTVTHNLGVVPDMFLFYAPSNIATTYSMMYAFRSSKFGWRSSSYLNLCGYHGNSTTTITATNVTTSYGIKTLTSTQATVTSYSTSSSYGWRAGTYEWIAIKFS